MSKGSWYKITFYTAIVMEWRRLLLKHFLKSKTFSWLNCILYVNWTIYNSFFFELRIWKYIKKKFGISCFKLCVYSSIFYLSCSLWQSKMLLSYADSLRIVQISGQCQRSNQRVDSSEVVYENVHFNVNCAKEMLNTCTHRRENETNEKMNIFIYIFILQRV